MLSATATVETLLDRRDLTCVPWQETGEETYGELTVIGRFAVRLDLTDSKLVERDLSAVVVTLRNYGEEPTQKLTLSADEIDELIAALTTAKGRATC